MAGAEAAVQHFICSRPEVPARLIKGNKFLKWPKADGDVSLFVFLLFLFVLFVTNPVRQTLTEANTVCLQKQQRQKHKKSRFDQLYSIRHK